MKYFVSATMKAALDFAKRTKSDFIQPIYDGKLARSCVLSDKELTSFLKSDVVIIGGTWGSELRKRKHLPCYEELGPNYIFNHKLNDFFEIKLSDKARNAIVDVFNTELVKIVKENNKPLIVLDSATLSRTSLNYDFPYNIKSYVRIGLDSWIYGDGRWLKTEDFDEIPVVSGVTRIYDHSWNMNSNGSIYILTGSEVDPTSTMPVYDFLDQSISEIRKQTDREIVIKLHPYSFVECDSLVETYENVKECDKRSPLKDHYEDMYCAVIDNSTSIFQLIDAGIPTFCSSVNFGVGLGNTDIKNIEDPFLADKDRVREWSYDMACTELKKEVFSTEEIELYIEKLLKRYY